MLPLLSGLAIGALGVFMFDPQQGRRRRALVRDQFAHGARKGRVFLDAAKRDAHQRAHGVAARAQALVRRGEVTPAVLEARVRTRLGRATPHPGAIHVEVADDHLVILTGNVLASEHEAILDAVRTVPGVRVIKDALAVHASAEGVSALQGAAAMGGGREGWTPATRLASGGAGAGLLLYGLARGGLTGGAALIGGALMLARAGVNHRLLRAGGK